MQTSVHDRNKCLVYAGFPVSQSHINQPPTAVRKVM